MKIIATFAVAIDNRVAWMSGLVTGLQNRAQRFESACDLNRQSIDTSCVNAFFAHSQPPLAIEQVLLVEPCQSHPMCRLFHEWRNRKWTKSSSVEPQRIT